jgi:hypothetical protein
MRRSRWILTAAAVAALAVLAVCWNVYFSWLRSLVLKDTLGSPVTVETARRKLFDTWVESGYLSLPLMGVKVHIADGAFIGAFGLAILMVILFYVMRRMNHLIARTLRLAQSAEDKLRLYIYYGISAFNVFTLITTDDNPVETLEWREGRSRIPLVRAAFSMLFFLPFIAIICLIACDLLSLGVIKSAFRDRHTPVLSGDTGDGDLIKLVLMEAWALVMAIGCAVLGQRCRSYHLATASVLRDFADRHVEPVLPQTTEGLSPKIVDRKRS